MEECSIQSTLPLWHRNETSTWPWRNNWTKITAGFKKLCRKYIVWKIWRLCALKPKHNIVKSREFLPETSTKRKNLCIALDIRPICAEYRLKIWLVPTEEIRIMAHDLQPFCAEYGLEKWLASTEEIRVLSLDIQHSWIGARKMTHAKRRNSKKKWTSFSETWISWTVLVKHEFLGRVLVKPEFVLLV